jgi:2-keto-4-pentenoate hydratase/2-oxohepta-3-ene-1,7-dioic acid hydratase in catechol pathway
MKLLTYSRNNTISCAILTEQGLIDIPSAWKGPNPPRSLKQILQKGQPCLDELAALAVSTEAAIKLDSVKLLAPIQNPSKLLALAGNYSEHIKEVGLRIGMAESTRMTTTPRPFIMPPNVLAGPDDIIPWPAFSQEIDYEIELAVVIGKTAKCVSEKEAFDYVAGYTIANDISARSVTFTTNRDKRPWDEFYDWLNGKWADSFLPMGPYFLTADEIDDVQNLNLTLKVNGEIRQNSNTSHMIHSVADIVSFTSHLVTLEPGDCIATGTPSGVALATGNFLKADDRLEATIDKLGTLANTLGPKPEELYEPLA